MTVDLRSGHVEVAEDVALRRLRDRQHPRRSVRRDPHRRCARRRSRAGSAGTAETAGGCSRGSSRPTGTASAAAARSAARGTDRPVRAADRAAPPAARGSSSADVSGTGRKFSPSSPRTRNPRRGRAGRCTRSSVEPRQVAQQVADVGADAVVAQLPGVDGDAHATASYRTVSGPSRRSAPCCASRKPCSPPPFLRAFGFIRRP